jgi:hypothetical protein
MTMREMNCRCNQPRWWHYYGARYNCLECGCDRYRPAKTRP